MMSYAQHLKNKISNSITVKLGVIAFLILLLQIPMSFVESLIFERQHMKNQARMDITQRWGGDQQIGTPILKLNYQKNKYYKKEDGSVKKTVNYYSNKILPKIYNLDVELEASKRYLGIYEAAVFISKLQLSGEIEVIPNLHIGDNDGWKNQSIFIPIGEMRGLRSIGTILINNKKQVVSQEQETVRGLSGITINLKGVEQSKKIIYQIDMTLAGSYRFNILPMAGQTNVSMSSNWSAPSFIGDFLPEKRNVSAKGFSANWKVNELNHNLGRVWKGDNLPTFGNSTPSFGTKILITANTYQVNTRTVKYGVLVMVLIFAGFFLAEMFFKLRLHPFQYLLMGFSLSVFYLLLLSISEYLRFEWAFWISATFTIGLIGGYCSVVLGKPKRGIYTAALFGFLYGYIFVLVKAEQLSLLMGALGVWMFLAMVMYLTRKIDWYAINTNNTKEPPEVLQE